MGKYDKIPDHVINFHAKHEARDIMKRIIPGHGEHWVRVKGPDGHIIDPKTKDPTERKFIEEVRKETRCLTRE